jgi:gamma-glutamyltranspeptidase/glutathione hydrolase
MKSTNQYRLIFPFLMTAFFISLAGCNTQNVSSTPHEKQKTQAQQAVAMPDSFAASVAMDVLNNGGNAVDAAIAAHFSLAVTFPEAGNIGGGGFMVIHYEGANDFLDYREVAPQNAHRDMYLNKDGEVNTNQSIYGVLASGVPG